MKTQREGKAMTTVEMQLPEDVERKAREAGLFSGKKINEMIEAEVRRQRYCKFAIRKRQSVERANSGPIWGSRFLSTFRQCLTAITFVFA